MAKFKISALNALLGADLDTANDLLCVVDTGAVETKNMTIDEFIAGIEDQFTDIEAATITTTGNGDIGGTLNANVLTSDGAITAVGNIDSSGGKVTATGGYVANNKGGANNRFSDYPTGAATGDYNCAYGVDAGDSITTGGVNTFYGALSGANNTEGDENTFIGASAGTSNNVGNNGVFIGRSSGYNNAGGNNNTFIGWRSGYTNISGSNNLIAGYRAGYNVLGSGNVFIGYEAGFNETGSNTLYIDNTSTANPLIYGDFSTDELTINGDLGVTGRMVLTDNKYVAANDSSAADKAKADYTCDGTDDQTEINNAISAAGSGGAVYLLDGTYNISGVITTALTKKLRGHGRETILDLTGSTDSYTIEVYDEISNLKITGTTTDGSFRATRIRDGAVAHHLWIEDNTNGLYIIGDGFSAHDLYFQNLKNTNGHACAVNVIGASVGNINRIDVRDCDRAIEIEDGANNIDVSNFYLADIISGVENYSFVIDAHTHNAGSAVTNISYKNGTLLRCDAITSSGSDDGLVRVDSVTFSNITVINPLPQAGWGAVMVVQKSDNITIDNVNVHLIGDETLYSENDVTNVTGSPSVVIAKQDVAGARDDTEAALANLLTALEAIGLITDSTTAT